MCVCIHLFTYFFQQQIGHTVRRLRSCQGRETKNKGRPLNLTNQHWFPRGLQNIPEPIDSVSLPSHVPLSETATGSTWSLSKTMCSRYVPETCRWLVFPDARRSGHVWPRSTRYVSKLNAPPKQRRDPNHSNPTISRTISGGKPQLRKSLHARAFSRSPRTQWKPLWWHASWRQHREGNVPGTEGGRCCPQAGPCGQMDVSNHLTATWPDVMGSSREVFAVLAPKILASASPFHYVIWTSC